MRRFAALQGPALSTTSLMAEGGAAGFAWLGGRCLFANAFALARLLLSSPFSTAAPLPRCLRHVPHVTSTSFSTPSTNYSHSSASSSRSSDVGSARCRVSAISRRRRSFSSPSTKISSITSTPGFLMVPFHRAPTTLTVLFFSADRPGDNRLICPTPLIDSPRIFVDLSSSEQGVAREDRGRCSAADDAFANLFHDWHPPSTAAAGTAIEMSAGSIACITSVCPIAHDTQGNTLLSPNRIPL